MKTIEGNIVDVVSKNIFKGRIFYNETIEKIETDESIINEQFILPGLIDAHVHIESSMLTPLEYSKIALKHGVIASITDPHEIANVCGMNGIRFMIDNAKLTPMKIFFGVPSCVPATPFETSGAILSSKETEELFASSECSHLSEMMNYPGVIYDNKSVYSKIDVAHKYNKIIDGHAPLLSGNDLRKYVKAGISTDHECSTIHEALEKISLGMKIMLRNGSAAKDFKNLITLIKTHPNEVMLCTDDCHPDDLERGYINLLVLEAIEKGYDIFDILTASIKTANDFYNLKIGLLQINDAADFIVVNNLKDFKIISTNIRGNEVYNHKKGVLFQGENKTKINNFYKNEITIDEIRVERNSKFLNVIQVIEDSLITKKLVCETNTLDKYIETDTKKDILKIVVLNRYNKAKPSVGFINGFNLKKGAIAGSIAHDSHNIIAVGVSDTDIIKAINIIHNSQGGLAVVNDTENALLSLPIAGLMSDKSCGEIAKEYATLSQKAADLGCTLKAPFMTLAFMSLLVIPELKLGDKGLFDVNKFQFIDLQN